jgi:hypothetical protein
MKVTVRKVRLPVTLIFTGWSVYFNPGMADADPWAANTRPDDARDTRRFAICGIPYAIRFANENADAGGLAWLVRFELAIGAHSMMNICVVLQILLFTGPLPHVQTSATVTTFDWLFLVILKGALPFALMCWRRCQVAGRRRIMCHTHRYPYQISVSIGDETVQPCNVSRRSFWMER